MKALLEKKKTFIDGLLLNGNLLPRKSGDSDGTHARCNSYLLTVAVGLKVFNKVWRTPLAKRRNQNNMANLCEKKRKENIENKMGATVAQEVERVDW